VIADLLAAAGKTDKAERFRHSARRHQAAARDGLREYDAIWAPGAIPGAGDTGDVRDDLPGQRRSGDSLAIPPGASAENRRLRAMVAALGSSRSGTARERQTRALWDALVDRCSADAWHGWSQALCEVATERLPTVAGTAIIAYDGISQELIAASDTWTESVEEIQQLLGEGPSLAAYTTRRAVVLAELATQAEKWPVYVSTVAASGVRSIWALPLRLAGTGLGVITFYRTMSGPPAAEEWPEAGAIAHAAVTALIGDADDLEDGRLPGATGSALVIHVATGILASRLQISPEEALARLRARAFSADQRLRWVAENVVSGKISIE
jgi:hypothetical protein